MLVSQGPQIEALPKSPDTLPRSMTLKVHVTRMYTSLIKK